VSPKWPAMASAERAGSLRSVSMSRSTGGCSTSGRSFRPRRRVSRLVSLWNSDRLGNAIRRSCSASLTRSRTKQTRPPAASTTRRTRPGNPGGTVASGANVKVMDRPARAASPNTAIQNSSRSRTNGSDPNGNTVVSRSTTRWLWKTGPPAADPPASAGPGAGGLGSVVMPFDADPRVDAYIDALPDWQQEVCRQVRELVHAADPDVVETIKRTVQPYFVLDGNICALLAAKDHVNVFLYDGGIVPDPEGIITAGHDNKTARTVAVRAGETLNAPALLAMFRQIIANNRAGGWRALTKSRG
jgi:hypothetical protein